MAVLTGLITLYVLMVMVHFAIDYQFQSNEVAQGKNPNKDEGRMFGVPWYYWMTSHASVHGLGVVFITHSMLLGVLETICHFGIDWLKCQKYTGIHIDQCLHVVCKAIWMLCFYYGIR